MFIGCLIVKIENTLYGTPANEIFSSFSAKERSLTGLPTETVSFIKNGSLLTRAEAIATLIIRGKAKEKNAGTNFLKAR